MHLFLYFNIIIITITIIIIIINRKKAKSKGILKTIDTEAAIEIIFHAKSIVTLKDVTDGLHNINCGNCILDGSEFKGKFCMCVCVFCVCV